jgi:hypothetical protein
MTRLVVEPDVEKFSLGCMLSELLGSGPVTEVKNHVDKTMLKLIS